jgi:hypothetical protein
MYIVRPVASNCTTCGRKLKKTVFIDGLPYGTECAKVMLNLVGDDLDAPIWLYTLADQYAQEEYQRGIGKDYMIYSWLGDLQCNFYSSVATAGKLWDTAITINGKRIKVAWQQEVGRYLSIRYSELTGKPIADFSDGMYYSNQEV